VSRREDLAWLAGFWDGEGCVSALNTENAKNYPVLSISQAGDEGKELCYRVAQIAGVRASISGPHRGRPGNKPAWKVRISGHERVQAVMAACWPWLSRTKREQAALVLLAYRAIRPAKVQRTHCPKCTSEWVSPNIVYCEASRAWRCRVCRRKNPVNAHPQRWHPRAG
jgi:hypothetical protein